MATEQSPADRYLELCMRRVRLWEQAEGRRAEHEQAEAFTRAFAELDATLREGGALPAAWAAARPPESTDDGGQISPVRELLGAHTVAVPKSRKDSMA